jgi:hypothetical protein
MEDPPRAAASAMMHSNDRPCHSPPRAGSQKQPGEQAFLELPSWEHSVRGGSAGSTGMSGRTSGPPL